MSSSFRRRQGQGQGQHGHLTSASPQKMTGDGQDRALLGSPVAAASLKGTKPWTGGVTLTSVGLRDLDTILGGGQPLGTCVLVEQDRLTPDLALVLCRYWCAEAISQEQVLLLPITNDNDDLSLSNSPSLAEDDMQSSTTTHPPFPTRGDAYNVLNDLPRNLHWEKQDQAARSLDSSETRHNHQQHQQPLEMLQEGDEEEEDEEDGDEGLQVAWQYRLSVQQERMGHHAVSKKQQSSSSSKNNTTKVYCHSYDLSGRMSRQRQGTTSIVTNDWWSTQTGSPRVILTNAKCACRSPTQERTKMTTRQCGHELYSHLLKQIKEHTANSQNKTVLRLFLCNAPISITCVALPLLLAYIRLHSLPVVVLVCIQPWETLHSTTPTARACLQNLRRTSDVVLQTQGFYSRKDYPPPLEFSHLLGLLQIAKVSTWTAATAHNGGNFCDFTTAKRPPAHTYGLKRDRRKLHIPLLHIPPEEYSGAGGSVGGNGVRSGAGKKKKQTSASSSGGGCGSGDSSSSSLDF